MLKFSNKNLLILGSNVGTVDIINYAKSNGAKTIVADYYDIEKSPAKQLADYHEEVSTNDIKGLINLCDRYKIDGIISGISEFNLLKVQELCSILKKPNYFNKEQWEKISNKDLFRKLCIEYGVSSPRIIYSGSNLDEVKSQDIEYPVIVKPVDGSMSQGVSICKYADELNNAFIEALKYSNSKKVIIEEFFNGDEFTAHYSIVNNIVNLACMDNRYPVSINEGTVTTIPIARVYPSTFLDKYLMSENEKVIKMIESLNIKNGICFIQGLYNKEKDKFCIFEGGLRCAGEAPYRFIEKTNGINFLNPIVDLSLGVETNDYDHLKENPFLNEKKCGVISFATKGGEVGEISGLEETVKKVNSLVDYECRYLKGDITPSGNTLRQLMIRFVLVCDSIEQMKSDISFINSNINVLNTRKENLVIKFNQERLNDEFKI
ncbi:MAG: ATP-grasp domain-containing protein [Lagierella massiliensis]|nr:ATP-grasp domain-containing protein [Lagierella massiliensis]